MKHYAHYLFATLILLPVAHQASYAAEQLDIYFQEKFVERVTIPEGRNPEDIMGQYVHLIQIDAAQRSLESLVVYGGSTLALSVLGYCVVREIPIICDEYDRFESRSFNQERRWAIVTFLAMSGLLGASALCCAHTAWKKTIEPRERYNNFIAAGTVYRVTQVGQKGEQHEAATQALRAAPQSSSLARWLWMGLPSRI